MPDDRPPFFSTFDDAWRSFAGGGQLTSMDAWRERLTAGRAQLLSFQVPLGETPIADDVEVIQDALNDIDGIAMFEREMLHISVRGVGFQVIAKKRPDDVTREDVGRFSKRAASVLRGAKAIAVEVGPLNVFHDALILEVHDRGALRELRRVLDEAPTDTFGTADDQYLPHITIAMFSDPVAAAPALRERLPALRERPPVAATVKRIELARWWYTGHEAGFPERDTVREYRLKG
jgi:2'-5' RNA ligase